MKYEEFLESVRKFRTENFKPWGRFLQKLKLTAALMTGFSFVFGLAAAYFLFENHLLFLSFIILHLLADALDGVLARLSKPTLSGRYFDHLTDRAVAFFLLVKIYFYLREDYVLIVMGLFLAVQTVYTFSKFRCPVIFVRTGMVIALMFFPLFPARFIPTGTYLVVGVFLLYALIQQLRYFLRVRYF